MNRIAIASLVAVAIVTAVAAAADWPQRRGPSRDGDAAVS
jgi:hypothetical protein